MKKENRYESESALGMFMIRRFGPGLLAVSLLVSLVSCSAPPCVPSSRDVTAQMGRPFVIHCNAPWNDTSIRLIKGRRYTISAHTTGDEPYSDGRGSLPACPCGVLGSKGRFFDRAGRDATGRGLGSRLVGFFAGTLLNEGPVHRLRVLQDADGNTAHFMTLIAATGHDDGMDNVYVIGHGRTFTARHGGKLSLFSNDWPGGPGTVGDERFRCSRTYANNTGLLEVTVQPAGASR